MNNELKKARVKLREIEKMCKARPLPTPEDIDNYIYTNNLQEYSEFASHVIRASWVAEWILHTKRINKSRV